MRTWLITGCSTGFGKSLAKAVADAGEQIAVTARNTDSLKNFEGRSNVLVVSLDVTDNGQIAEAVNYKFSY